MWLFNPAIKTGHTKKLSSLWRGPYTVIDRLSSVNGLVTIVRADDIFVTVLLWC